MQNLNKENFWNQMLKDAPLTMDMFLHFIDDYKKEVNWKALFTEDTKFHDIPVEMQIGIIDRFITEQMCKPPINANEKSVYQMDFVLELIKHMLTNKFLQVEHSILERNSPSIKKKNAPH